jgi:hypothetical protein
MARIRDLPDSYRLSRLREHWRLGTGLTEARGQQLAAGRGTIIGSGNAAPWAVERLTYHALLAGPQALLAEDDAGALTIAAAPAAGAGATATLEFTPVRPARTSIIARLLVTRNPAWLAC